MREDDMLRLSLECARLMVQGENYKAVLVAGTEKIMQADAGVGLTTWTLSNPGDGGGSVSGIDVVVAGIPPLGAEDKARALSVAARHPWLGRTDRFSEPTHRVSDHVCLPRFWDTDIWRNMHGYGDGGGRYPAAVNLGVHGRAAVFLGLHRAHRDFTDNDMEVLERVRGPLTAALAFRTAWDQAVDQLQGGLGASQPGRVSQREGQVLALVSRGWTNRRVGHALGITERTVRRHLENVNAKLGVSNRAAAAAWWQSRLVPRPYSDEGGNTRIGR